MREGFHEIADGWMLITGTEDLDDRIERLAEWTKANGPLEPDEEATVKFMIECQIARHMDPNGGLPYDADVDDEFSDCGLQADGTCALAGTEWCDWDCPYSD